MTITQSLLQLLFISMFLAPVAAYVHMHLLRKLSVLQVAPVGTSLSPAWLQTGAPLMWPSQARIPGARIPGSKVGGVPGALVPSPGPSGWSPESGVRVPELGEDKGVISGTRLMVHFTMTTLENQCAGSYAGMAFRAQSHRLSTLEYSAGTLATPGLHPQTPRKDDDPSRVSATRGRARAASGEVTRLAVSSARRLRVSGGIWSQVGWGYASSWLVWLQGTGQRSLAGYSP